MKNKKIGIIGVGNMGGAIAVGLLKSGFVAAADIFVADKKESTLNKMKDLNGCLSPQVLTVDFELAVINAFQQVFDGLLVKGCFFHFAQANWREAQQLGLAKLYAKRTKN